MKKFYYLLLAFSFMNYAQSVPPGENISLDSQLTNINQSSVTSGIIYERVVQIPISKEVYEPILKELASFGIHFTETEMPYVGYNPDNLNNGN
jgi:acyl-CoA hydrolase